jgi:NAD(P)-dependent dehydrogenase (short-subunit alcohol dehydrogenase family)
MVEELAKARSIRQIATWLDTKLGSAPPPTPTPAPAPAPASLGPTPTPFPLRRFVVKPLTLPAAQPNGFRLEGRKFVLTDDGRGVAIALARELEARNAHVTIGTDLTGADGVIHLAPLSTDGDDHRKLVFDVAQRAVAGGAQWLCAATGRKPEHGGVAALLKSVAKEHPQVRVRAIDLDPGESPEAIAGTVLAELLADDPHVQVAYEAGERRTFHAVETASADATTPLGPDDVVLITGGARGITARAAIALARTHRCAIELVGRTPAPGPEDAEVAAATDAAGLRKLLAARGERVPAKIEAQVKQCLAERELRATFAALDASGAPWRYHAADVRDAAAVEGVLADIYARRGRLDAIIHGAGVIEDRLMRDKTRDSFDRVFDTKVAGARALLAHARDDLRLVVFFSSVSGVFGNRGQTDYAAANEALDHLARDLARTRPRTRVLSVAWGPWGGTGMISPELEREYAQRGVGLIDPEAGVARLLAELGGDDPHVVYMSATPEALE